MTCTRCTCVVLLDGEWVHAVADPECPAPRHHFPSAEDVS